MKQWTINPQTTYSILTSLSRRNENTMYINFHAKVIRITRIDTWLFEIAVNIFGEVQDSYFDDNLELPEFLQYCSTRQYHDYCFKMIEDGSYKGIEGIKYKYF